MRFLINSFFDTIYTIFIPLALIVLWLFIVIALAKKLGFTLAWLISIVIPAMLYWFICYLLHKRFDREFEDKRYTNYWLTLNKRDK